jgi:hypothetical protein
MRTVDERDEVLDTIEIEILEGVQPGRAVPPGTSGGTAGAAAGAVAPPPETKSGYTEPSADSGDAAPMARSGAGRDGATGGATRDSGEVRGMLASLYRITRDAGVDLDPGRLGLDASDTRGRLGVRASGLSDVSGVSGVSGTSACSLDSLGRESRMSGASCESADVVPQAMIRALPLPLGQGAGGADAGAYGGGSAGGSKGRPVAGTVNEGRRYRGGVI